MDQLVIFMSIAHGESKILCPKTSSITSKHLQTAIYFAELLSGVKFTMKEITEDSLDGKFMKGTQIISVIGLGIGKKQEE